MSSRPRALRAAGFRAALASALIALVGGAVLVPTAPAVAADPDPAYVSFVKSASPAPPTAVGPGETVTFTFSINCSSDVAGCVDLQVTDELPDPFVLENVSMSSSSAEGDFETTDDSFTLTFTNDLGGGEQGLPDGYSVEFIATGRVPADVSASYDGQTVVNEAFATLAYTPSNTSDTASVLLEVPTVLASDLDKTVDPTVADAVPGEPVEYTFEVANTSNSDVDALVVQDPVTVGVSPFHYLEPTDLEVETWPSGADRLQVDWYDGSSWQTGSPSASPVIPTPGVGDEIEGLRFTFTSSSGSVAEDAFGVILLGTEARDNVAGISGSATVTNTASSWVRLESATSSPVSDSATVRLDEVSVAALATKTFSPDSLVGGQTTTVTLRGEVGGDFDAADLVITEPATGQPDLVDQGLTFDGWVDGDLQWPLGATSADVAFFYDGDADFSAATTIAAGAAMPDPAAGVVRAIRIAFHGVMEPGQYAVVAFDAVADAASSDVTSTDTISVDVVTTGPDPRSASTTASDDLTRRSARVESFITKTARPDDLYAVEGATTVLTLVGGVSPRPTTPGDSGGSTIGASSLVITDPVDAGADFWEAFALDRISATDVPAGSALTVEYLDVSGEPTWTQLGAVTTGPTLFSHVLSSGERSALGGIRFSYAPVGQDELPPGFTVQINMRVALLAAGIDGEASEDYPIVNVAEATVQNDGATPPTFSDTDPVTFTMTPVGGGSGGSGGGPGSLPLVDKAWDDELVNARSGDTAGVTISWGTGGLGYDSVVISDTASDPDVVDVEETVYDAFDLVAIEPITSGDDALLRYDRVTAVELYIPGSGWVATATNPCAGAACDGAFPGYTLSETEREQAIGVRLVVEESPTRASRISASDPYAPPVGSGVAASTGRDRDIELVFQLRDERRSDASPVLGSSRGVIYNTGEAGVVSNSALVEGRDESETVLASDVADDTIQLVDRPLNVTAGKAWTGGPLGVPEVGTPAELFPQSRMTLSATNATVVPVDELSLLEPGIDGAGTVPDPFDVVDLVDIVSISVPAGAETTTVTLGPASSYPDPFTLSEALALTTSELADATSIEVSHTGRIAAGAQTVVVLDARLREFLRSDSGTRVGTAHSPVANSVLAQVSDEGGLWAGDPEDAPAPGEVSIVSDQADASITIEAPVTGVTATKLITAGTSATSSVPAIQYAGSSTTATVSLRGQPGGNVRYTEMILEDDSATFWNAYVFTGFSSHSFANPLNRVQVDALVGVTYGVDGEDITETGGSWVLGTPSTTLTLPAGVSAADVRGLRFTYTRADYSAWERPYNPQQTVTFTVSRRDDLLTGGPVPSTLYIHDPGIAPGETERATFTDDLDVTVNARETPESPALWTASDSDTKQLRYQHLPAKVEIRTSPTGEIALGDTIDYRITAYNFGGAGDKALTGVVITDLLPVDGLGDPYLVFPDDPDTDAPYDPNVAADAAELFTFELRNASNVLQPTPTVGVVLDTVETSPGSGVYQPRLTFTLSGSLPVGYTLSIAAPMQFRAQLEAGTPVTTTATVVSDQEFDSCGRHYIDNSEVTPGSLGSGTPPFTETESCFTSTTVSPLPSAPLTVAKGVKGIEAGPLDASGDPIDDPDTSAPYDDLGVVNVSSSSTMDCSVPNTSITVDGGDYYRYPCVPITRPGATEQWASSFTNSGNVSVRQIVAIDVLPRPGDTGVTISTPRGSQWTAQLSSYPTAPGLPAGATLTVYYTDQTGVATARCNGADIQDTMGMTPTSDPPMQSSYQSCLTDTGADDDLPNRVWSVLPNDPEVWETVVALKFVILMDDSEGLTNLLPPGGQASVIYRTTTALVPELVNTTSNLGLDSIAYNSIAAAATGRIYEDTAALDLAYRLVTEPRKVGVALAVGELELRKENTGAAASYAPSTVQVTLACTVDVDGEPQAIDLLNSSGADRSTLTLTPGVTTLVQGIPLYADCAVTEADDYGRTDVTYSPSGASIIAQAATSAGSRTVYDPHPVYASRPSIERATVTNDYQAAGLTLSKTVETNGAVNHNDDPIVYTSPVFSVSCRFDNGVTNPVIFSVSNLTIASGNSLTFPRPATSDPVLPAGAVCTVTETNSRNATTTQYTVTTAAGTGSATTGTSTTVTLTPNDESAATNAVAFTNTYGVGSFTVTKNIAGLGAATYGTGDFTVSVVCTRASASPSTVWSGTFTLNAGDPSRTITDLPAASVCTVTETNAAGATSTTFSPQQSGVPTAGRATVPNGSTATVTITNTFDLARLSVTKDVRVDPLDTGGDPVYSTDLFDMEVTCTFQGSVVLADGYSASPMALDDMTRDETRVLTGLPAGASCVVEEVAIPDEVDSTSIEWVTSAGSGSAAATSATIVLTRDSSPTVGTNTATVVNRYGVTAFTVTKDVQGGAGDQFGTGPFEIDVTCVAPNDVVAFDDTLTLPTSGGAWFDTVENLPHGSTCDVVETGTGDVAPDAIRYLDGDDEPFDGTGVLVTTADPGAVTVENWYLTGALTVGKETEGDGATQYGTGTFEITLACTLDVDGTDVIVDGYPASQTLQAGGTVTFTGLPSGADCVVTETDPAGATSSRIVQAADHGTVLAADAAVGHAFTVAVDAGELTDDQAQPAVDVINVFELAGLAVTKTVQSDAVDETGAAIEYGPFPVAVSCEFEGEQIYATGYDAETPMQNSFSEGDPAWNLSGLVVGAECDIVETDRLGSASSRVTTTPSGGSGVIALASDSSDTVTGSIVLTARVGIAAENLAAIRNDYESGTVELSKAVTGDGAAWATEPFSIRVVCTLDDGPVDATVWDATYTVTSASLAIDDLARVAAGAECDIEETKTGGATSTTIDVDGSVTAGTTAAFVIPSDAALPVAVTNTFELADIDVTKTRLGDADIVALYGIGPFEVTAVCTREVDGETLPITVPGGATRSLTAVGSYQATFAGLPAGADCEITETGTGGANDSTVTPGSLELAVGGNDVDVENEYTAGSVDVDKTRLGDGVALYGDGPFYVTLVCTREVNGAEVAVDIPAPSTPIEGVDDPAVRALTLENGYQAEYADLPTGADCAISETGTGGATETEIDVPEFAIGDGVAQAVEVTNTFVLTQLIVDNTVTGNASKPYMESDFVILLQCERDMNGVATAFDIPDGAERLFKHGETVEYLQLPVGAQCAVYEIEDHGANLVEIRQAGRLLALVTLSLDPVANEVNVLNVFVRLASTGVETAGLLAIALVVFGAGIGLLALRRRLS